MDRLNRRMEDPEERSSELADRTEIIRSEQHREDKAGGHPSDRGCWPQRSGRHSGPQSLRKTEGIVQGVFED